MLQVTIEKRRELEDDALANWSSVGRPPSSSRPGT